MTGATSQFLIFSFLSGLLPAILWLWFWTREDKHPEPKKILFLTFIYGAAMIPIVFTLEYLTQKLFIKINLTGAFEYSMLLIFALAAIEEYFKYFAAKHAALKKKYFDEPADAIVYMITAALGFAAVENMIYIFGGFMANGVVSGFLSGNLRFLGATPLHILTSGILGVSIAFSFLHKEHAARNEFLGFSLAVLLHGFFNYFIISNISVIKIFLTVWILSIAIIYIFEKLKK